MDNSETELLNIRARLAWWLDALQQEFPSDLLKRQIARFHEVCVDAVPTVEKFIEACTEAMKIT
jgi:hypothetical protein